MAAANCAQQHRVVPRIYTYARMLLSVLAPALLQRAIASALALISRGMYISLRGETILYILRTAVTRWSYRWRGEEEPWKLLFREHLRTNGCTIISWRYVYICYVYAMYMQLSLILTRSFPRHVNYQFGIMHKLQTI